MKKTLWIFMASALLVGGAVRIFGSTQSGEKKDYTDAKKILASLAELMEDFVDKMDKTDEADQIAMVLDSFSDSMEEMVPYINEINAKYPELRDESTHPEVLKPILKRVADDFQALMKSYSKVMENIEDPAVKDADAKYREVMAGLK